MMSLVPESAAFFESDRTEAHTLSFEGEEEWLAVENNVPVLQLQRGMKWERQRQTTSEWNVVFKSTQTDYSIAATVHKHETNLFRISQNQKCFN